MRRIHDGLWLHRAHPAQRPPDGAWRTWIFLGGRGAGKTRAGAEWVRAEVESGRRGRIALVAPTLHDAREVMIEGPSGLRAIAADPPTFEPSRRRLVWPNGALGFVFSAEDPDSLRGPQFDGAWADEICAWPRLAATLDVLRPALRLGADPRLVATSTPKPSSALKRLLAAKDTALTRASSRANAAHLAPGFIEAMEALWAGTTYGRQELQGELLEDLEGALWTRADVDAALARAFDPPDEIVVAVDPPAGVGAGADLCGIVAAGASGSGPNRRAVVLADASVQGLAPQGWAARAAGLARALGANRIVAEANNGGEMVRAVLAVAAVDCPVRLVHASLGKRARAEPVAALYAVGRVAHAAAMPDLVDQMCAFGAEPAAGSPDRVDALVWALSDLLLARGDPRLRPL